MSNLWIPPAPKKSPFGKLRLTKDVIARALVGAADVRREVEARYATSPGTGRCHEPIASSRGR